MKFRIWPFCTDDDDNTEKRIIIEDVPLEQVSCDVLKEEIERRKKEKSGVSKKDVARYIKEQNKVQNESINTDLADALSKLKF